MAYNFLIQIPKGHLEISQWSILFVHLHLVIMNVQLFPAILDLLIKSILSIEYEHVRCSKYKLHGANGATIGLVVGTEQYLKSRVYLELLELHLLCTIILQSCRIILTLIITWHACLCDVTLSAYPHRAGLKNMPGHGGIRTYDLWNTSPMLFLLSYVDLTA